MSDNQTPESAGSRKNVPAFYRNPANNNSNYHNDRFSGSRYSDNYNDYRYNQDNYYDRRDYNRSDFRNRWSRWDNPDIYRDRYGYSSRSPDFNRSAIYRDYDRSDKHGRRDNNQTPKNSRSKSANKDSAKGNSSPRRSSSITDKAPKNEVNTKETVQKEDISKKDSSSIKKTEKSSQKDISASSVVNSEKLVVESGKSEVNSENQVVVDSEIVKASESSGVGVKKDLVANVLNSTKTTGAVSKIVKEVYTTTEQKPNSVSYPNISKHVVDNQNSKSVGKTAANKQTQEGNKPSPVVNKTRSVVNKPKPVVNKFKPVVNKSKPVVNTPRSEVNVEKPVNPNNPFAKNTALLKTKKTKVKKSIWIKKIVRARKTKSSQNKAIVLPKPKSIAKPTSKPAQPAEVPPTGDNSISSTSDFQKEPSSVPKARSPTKNRIPTIPKSSLIFQKSSKFIPIEQYKRQFGISLVRKPFETKKSEEKAPTEDKSPKEKESESEPQRPKIFLTPIAKLLKSPEQLEQEKQSFIKETQQLNNGPPKKPSELLNQVNRMDKDKLKDIINNPLSKFSSALKIQARKRLSSELREKRKLCLEEKDSSDDTPADFELHDDIIEASKLPPELLEELTKILGEGNMPETVSQKSETPPPASKSPDLMSRIQTAEAAKSMRKSCETDPPVTSSSPKKIEELPQSYRNDNAVVINTSDSSSDEEEVAPLDKYELNSHNIIRKFQDDVLPLVCTRVANKFNDIVTKDNDVKRALRFILRFYLSNLTESENINGSLIKRLNRSMNAKDKTFVLDFLYRKTPKLIDRVEDTNSKKLLNSIRRDSRKSNHHEISSTSTPMLTPDKNSSSTSSESSEQSTGLSNKIENEGDVKDNEISPSKKTDEFVIVADNTEEEDEVDDTSGDEEERMAGMPAMNTSPSTLLNANLMELNNLKILTLMKENQISDVVLSNIKQLDSQIMETQHRKMYIEENILRLQKDKMEADMQIMRLQNEKFILLTTSLPKKDDFNKLEHTPTPVKRRRRTISAKAKTPVTTSAKKRRTASERSNECGESQAIEKVPEEDTYAKLKEGSFVEHKSPIVILEIVGDIILAASEEGHVYKYNLYSKKLEGKFTKHTQTITQLMMYSKFFVMTTSLDGHIKQTTIENFGLELQSIDVHEPIQSLDISWDIAFMGSRWGNVFTYNIKKNKLSQTLLCTIDSSVIALKCTTEGPRRILIVSSKGNGINFRDATSGLLLRSIEIPSDLYVNSLLLLGGYLYCGTQKNSIYKFYFSSGEQISVFNCGNGISTIKLFKNRFLMLGCYDGFIYVVDMENGNQIGRILGAGKMVLGLAIAGNKIISSSKDNAMEAINIPSYFLSRV